MIRNENLAKFLALLLLTLMPCPIRTAHPAETSSPRPLPVEDAVGALGFANLMPVALSPSGEWLAYTVKNNRRSSSGDLETWVRTGVRDIYTGTDIWMTNTQTGELKKLTSDKGANFLPVWSPDGHYLGFLSDRDGSGQARLWVWDSVRNESKMVTDLDVKYLGQIEWTPDSRHVLIPTLPQGMSTEDYVKRSISPQERRESEEGRSEIAPAVILYRSSPASLLEDESKTAGPWSLDIASRDLSRIDVVSGKATTIVHDQRIQNFLLSPDGSRVAYTVLKHFKNPPSQQEMFDLAVTTLSTGSQRIVAKEIELGFNGLFNWSPDESHLSYRTYGPEERRFDCFVVGLDGGRPRNITGLELQRSWPRHTSESGLWDASGEHVYFITNGKLWRASVKQDKAAELTEIPGHQIQHLISRKEGLLWTSDDGKSTTVITHDEARKQDGFYKIDLTTGAATKLLERNQCYTCTNAFDRQLTAVGRDGQHVAYYSEDSQHDADLWMSDATFSHPQRLTHLNPRFDESKMGDVQLVDWLSDDGDRLRGTLILPADYQTGKRYPLVVAVYGGSNLSDGFSRFGGWAQGPLNMQLLATRGFAVLLPDAPQRLGTPMADLAKSVLPGINRVIEMGIADPKMLGLIGHSYGGYSVLALLVQTNRFQAAVEMDGLGDLVAGYGEMDKDGSSYLSSVEEHGQGLMGGNPWQFRLRYLENSPTTYLERIETPLLIIHGAEDTSVAPFLGDEIFVGLRSMGKEVEYAKYRGEGHSPLFWSYPNQVDLCNRVNAWFEAHLH